MNTPSYQVGDLVWIRPEWDGDHTLHVVVEWNEDRGYVRPEHWPHGPVIPQELVTAEMLEPAKMVQNSDGPNAAARERTRP
jgi:hypothetical protein